MTEKIIPNEKLSIGSEILIFIGPEGSGKTTMAKMLAEKSGKPYLTTGDILRDLAQNDHGEWGDKCRAIFTEHTYLDGETFLEILVDRFRKADMANGFILDGGLRTLEETVKFQEMLEAAERALPVKVMHLRIPGWMCLERLVYGDNARKRRDDTPEGVMNRLSMYYARLDERVRVIESQPTWKLAHIDATKEIGSVFEAVCSAVAGE